MSARASVAPERARSRRFVVVAAVLLVLGLPFAGVAFLATGVGSALVVLWPQAASSGAGATCGLADAGPGESFEMVSTTGETFVLGDRQLDHARTMLAQARAVLASPRAELVLVITVMPETQFRNLTNTTAVPESAGMSDEGDGSDHDSLGVLQQRPSTGWGGTAELMDPAYATRAFLGGPAGPNGGSPAGLLDVAGWEAMTPGEAAQAVQVSAFPDRYDTWVDAAGALLSYLGGCSDAAHPLGGPAPISDGVGPRECQVGSADGGCASSTWHPALDFASACGAPVFAARSGTVLQVSEFTVAIATDEGTLVSYLHMFRSDVLVQPGDAVTAGQRIGAVGDAGPSTGCHLDFRVNTLSSTDPAVLALPHVGEGQAMPGFVDPEAYMRLFGIELVA